MVKASTTQASGQADYAALATMAGRPELFPRAATKVSKAAEDMFASGVAEAGSNVKAVADLVGLDAFVALAKRMSAGNLTKAVTPYRGAEARGMTTADKVATLVAIAKGEEELPRRIAELDVEGLRRTRSSMADRFGAWLASQDPRAVRSFVTDADGSLPRGSRQDAITGRCLAIAEGAPTLADARIEANVGIEGLRVVAERVGTSLGHWLECWEHRDLKALVARIDPKRPAKPALDKGDCVLVVQDVVSRGVLSGGADGVPAYGNEVMTPTDFRA